MMRVPLLACTILCLIGTSSRSSEWGNRVPFSQTGTRAGPEARAAADGFYWTASGWMRAGDSQTYRWTPSGWVLAGMADAPAAQLTAPVQLQRQVQSSEYRTMIERDSKARQDDYDRRAAEIRAKQQQQPTQKEYSLEDVLKEIDQQYPFVGMAGERAAARAAAIQRWLDNKALIETTGGATARR
jgi:hypothetical protein